MRVRDIMTTKVFTIAVGMGPRPPHPGRRCGQPGGRHHQPPRLLRASLSALSTKFAEAERRQHLAGAPALAIMHHPARTIGLDASVQEAAGMMRRFKFGCLPVVEEDRLVGIVTEYDILQLVEQLPPDALTPSAPPAASPAPGA